MTPPPKLFQALLRPSILQILRATGFHSTRPAVLDSLAELAGAYLHLLCQATAAHADSHRRLHAAFEDNGTAWAPDGAGGGMAPSVVDVRMALQDVGALLPERAVQDQALRWPPPLGDGARAHKRPRNDAGLLHDHGSDEDGGVKETPTQETNAFGRGFGNDGHDGRSRLKGGDEDDEDDEDDQDETIWLRNEDLRGVQEFIAWFAGPRMRELQALAMIDGEPEATDYLNALKKKHSKTGEDARFHGTILGKGNDAGEILIEGGDVSSVQAWMDRMHKQALFDESPYLHANGAHASDSGDDGSRPPSSGLSSLGDRIGDDAGGPMDLS